MAQLGATIEVGTITNITGTIDISGLTTIEANGGTLNAGQNFTVESGVTLTLDDVSLILGPP